MSARTWFVGFVRARRILVAGVAIIAVTAVVVATMPTQQQPGPAGDQVANLVGSPQARNNNPEMAPPPRLVPQQPVLAGRLGTSLYTSGGHNPVFSHDGKRLAVLGWYHVHVYDVATRAELFSVRINPTNVFHSPDMGVRFCPSGEIVGFWCGYQTQPALVWRIQPDGTHSNYPITEGKLKQVFDQYSYYEHPAREFSINDDGSRLVVNWSGVIRLYDTASGDVIHAHKTSPGVWRAGGNTGVTLSRNGQLLTLATNERVQLLSVESGEELDSWESPPWQHPYPPHVAFNRDGTRALVTRWGPDLTKPGAAHIRDFTAKKTEEIPQDVAGPLWWTAYSPFGDLVALVPLSESERPVAVWNTTTKTILHRLEGTGRSTSLAFSPAGLLAVTDREGVTGLWEMASGQPAPTAADPPAAVRQLRYLDDGRQLAGFAGRWVSWDVPTKQRTDRLAGAGRAPGLSPDGRLAAKLDGDQLTVLNAETGKERWSAKLEAADRFTRVLFSPDGTRLVTRTREMVRVWDVTYGRELSAVPVLAGQYLLAVSKDARRVAIGYRNPDRYGKSNDGREFRTHPAVYDTVTQKKLWDSDMLLTESYPAMFSPDDRFLVYEGYWETDRGGRPAGVVVRDATTGRVAWRTERLAAYGVAISPDSRLLALGQHGGKISLFEATGGKALGEFAHRSSITALAFSPDGKTLAVASPDAPINLWDVSGIRAALPQSPP